MLFGLVVPRLARSAEPATWALVLAGLALVSFLVFYFGLPSILAAAAVATAVESSRRAGRWPRRAVVAVVLAALAVAQAVLLAFVG